MDTHNRFRLWRGNFGLIGIKYDSKADAAWGSSCWSSWRIGSEFSPLAIIGGVTFIGSCWEYDLNKEQRRDNPSAEELRGETNFKITPTRPSKQKYLSEFNKVSAK